MTAAAFRASQTLLPLFFDSLGLGFARLVSLFRSNAREHKMRNTLWLPFRALRKPDRHRKHFYPAPRVRLAPGLRAAALARA